MGNSRKNKGRSKPRAKTLTKPQATPRSTTLDTKPGASTPASEIISPGSPEKQKNPINCHYVPQWILRNFARQEGSTRNRPTVYYYDAENGTLDRRNVREVYAERGLFRDPDNPPGVDTYEIEDGIALLENKASKTMTYINKAIEKRDRGAADTQTPLPTSFTIKREYLEYLRKFMFIMYYHQVSIGETFYNENHPDNARSRAWIKEYRKRNNLSDSPQDTWLHVLRYYLRSNHKDIMKLAEEAEMTRMQACFSALRGPLSGMDEMQAIEKKYRSMEIDPALEGWKCLAYHDNMQMFLTIWEAAQGEEFIISDNSFGLYEGRTEQAGPMHKFYIVSPRIALVLCHPGLKETSHVPEFVIGFNPWQLNSEARSMSMLWNAPHKAARVRYINKKPPPANRTILYGNPGAGSPSPADVFEFDITPLSVEATHTVNAIILGNVHDDGKVTFGSKAAALQTLGRFGDNQEFDHERKLKFLPLVKELLKSIQTPPPSDLARFEPAPESIVSLCVSLIDPAPGKLWGTSLCIYDLLHEQNDALCIGYRAWEEINIRCWPKRGPSEIKGRPAQVVRQMDNRLAKWVFDVSLELMPMSMDSTFRDGPFLLRQLVIRWLEHMLIYQRLAFENFERKVIELFLRTSGGVNIPEVIMIIEYTDVSDEVPIAMEGTTPTEACDLPTEGPSSSDLPTGNNRSHTQGQSATQSTPLNKSISLSEPATLAGTKVGGGPQATYQHMGIQSTVTSEKDDVSDAGTRHKGDTQEISTLAGGPMTSSNSTSKNESLETRYQTFSDSTTASTNRTPLHVPVHPKAPILTDRWMAQTTHTSHNKRIMMDGKMSVEEPTAMGGTYDSEGESVVHPESSRQYETSWHRLQEERPKLAQFGFCCIVLTLPITYYHLVVAKIILEIVGFIFQPILTITLTTRASLLGIDNGIEACGGPVGGRVSTSGGWYEFTLAYIYSH